MKHIFLFFICLFFVGCKYFSSSEVERTKHADVNPRTGQNWTEARIESLNAYANSLLSAQNDADDFQNLADAFFQKNNISNAKPLKDVFSIAIRPGSECFQDGGLLESENDIWWNSHRDALRLQIESAAEFLFEFHKLMMGQSRGPFAINEIEICPKNVTQTALSLSGRKLVLGIDDYEPMNSFEIKKRWDAGEHIFPEEKSFTSFFTPKTVSGIWLIFNPIGIVRTNLRNGLREQGSNLKSAIGKYLGLPTPNSAEIKNAVLKEIVNTQVNSTAFSQAPEILLQQVVSQEKLINFLKNWQCLAQNLELQETLAQGALSAVDLALKDEKNEIDVSIKAGLVAVGNYHRIGVTFAANAGPYQKFISQPVFRSRSSKVTANVAGGLVSVFTIDDINVDVAVTILSSSLNKSLQSASFEEAVATTLRNQILSCQ